MVLQDRGRLFCESAEVCSCQRRDKLYCALTSGDFAFSDLKVGKLLGSGGFGSVYEASYRGERMALKRLHKETKNERAARESFEAETSALNFAHPNIVRTFTLFTIQDTNCVLMEYAGDRNLLNVIYDPSEALTNERRTKFAVDIARGLDYAHAKGIAHLDLKPGNVLVGANDHCKLADFGCCQAIEENHKPASPTKSNLTGTYAYRAPELLRGETPSTKADIYSYGICLWQMLTRERPYGNENQHVVIFGVVAYQLRPRIARDMSDDDGQYVCLVQQCWEADHRLRPATGDILIRLYQSQGFQVECKDLSSSSRRCRARKSLNLCCS